MIGGGSSQYGSDGEGRGEEEHAGQVSIYLALGRKGSHYGV